MSELSQSAVPAVESAPDKVANVRRARADDAARIVAVVQDLAAHVEDRALATVTVAKLLAANLHWRGFVAEQPDGHIVGACLYSFIFSTWKGVPGLYVIDLFVDQNQRGNGVGHALLAAAARDGMDNGCGFIRLEVDHNNPTAAGFYERLGFEEVMRNRTFTISGAAFEGLASQAAGKPEIR